MFTAGSSAPVDETLLPFFAVKELGRVLSAERRGTRCVVDTFWVEPGRKTLVVKGVRQTVNVKAGETVGSGECG